MDAGQLLLFVAAGLMQRRLPETTRLPLATVAMNSRAAGARMDWAASLKRVFFQSFWTNAGRFFRVERVAGAMFVGFGVRLALADNP